MEKLKDIFAITTCLWGGRYNPIIPYFDEIPAWWNRDKRVQRMGLCPSAGRIINGYLEFFEPDFVVEAEKGLAHKLGIKSGAILQLEDLLRTESENTSKGWGLNTFELYAKEEFKIRRKNELSVARIRPADPAFEPFTAAVFGSFPQAENLRYIERAYGEALDAQELHLDAQKLGEHYKKPISTPLDVGSEKVNVTHSCSYDPILFILDAIKPQDLVDFWNLRAIEKNVWAVPIQWIADLAGFCKGLIDKHHIPLPGNPHGVMIKNYFAIFTFHQ